MLISKFDLYRTEWLDLVFDDRNKDYGAYNLRQHYASTMVSAMLITFTGVAVIFGGTFLFRDHAVVNPLPKNDTTVVSLREFTKPPEPVKPKPQTVHPLKAIDPIKTIQNLPPVVTEDNLAKPPVKNEDLNKAASGQITTLNGKSGEIEIPVDKPSDGGGTAPAVDDKLYTPYSGLEQMPEPEGGMNAWSKFLNKNLRFPPEAQEENISGKVWLSFIIEKDGHLSNIVVDKGAGHGFDEEALRVLKLAKAWKPGKQNGLAVRVKYSIPINFQLSGE